MGAVGRPIRVLHLRDSPWVDGPGRTILETAAHVDRARITYQVGLLVPKAVTSHPLLEALGERGSTVYRIDDGGGLDRDVVEQVLRIVREEQIDILHASEFRTNVLVWWCGLRCSAAIATTSHGWIANDLRGRVYRLLDKLLLRTFDGIIFVSSATRGLVPNWWLTRSKVLVLRNALDLERYGRSGLQDKRHGAKRSREFIFLNVGRLSAEKGQQLLLEAFAVVAARQPSVRLHFAGIGPLLDDLTRRAGSLGILDKVKFLGYVKDMPALYAEVDAVVQSSLTEGLPNVVLEAAYLRVPVLATAVGGTGEILKDGESALLFEAGSIEQLAQAMNRVINDPQGAFDRADVAHDIIRRQFSFAARTERLMEFYEALASGR